MTTAREVRERPILFAGEMIRAVLDGRKTQTRRILTNRNSECSCAWNDLDWSTVYVDPGLGGGAYLKVSGPDDAFHRVYCRYAIGDRLRVRETWKYADWTEDGYPFIAYQADNSSRLIENYPSEWAERVSDTWSALSDPSNYRIDNRAADRRWRPSIHMPLWASRLTLEITGVRVERLREISEADARAEGVEPLHVTAVARGPNPFYYRDEFSSLWDSLNAKREGGAYAWDRNPWVWVIEFRKSDSPLHRAGGE